MQPVATESNDGVLDQFRPWIDLPRDILSDIADRLTLIELLSFRGTCKDFLSVSAGKSAQIQSRLPPWILTFHENDCSECILYNDLQSKTYKRKIPELDGVYCLASYQGWLLLFRDGLLFFFCPISFSKISLPEFPHHCFDGHVASFSDVPTSPNCIVAVINRADVSQVEVNVIAKGEKSWTQHMVPKFRGMSTAFTAATFIDKKQTFYFMDNANSLLSFSLKDKKWKPYQIVTGKSKDMETLPYRYIENVFKKSIAGLKGPLELEDDEDIAVCGFTYQNHSTYRRAVYLNEYIDTLDANKRVRRVVWIQPRFFIAARNHHW
ncbi:F-box/kelch-repeat protein At1g57790-like [Cynara cardunculus var. scolymus]|uniref:F-box/kelch-repeat protein At1g57790-like n=1 Tax=Cynara cardunculus var. scolymus TaxID=59895 RepID=UPI000D62BB1F|nr:F-box/kelch-repeat protein At1g57790-like [Cynara cardunculus var. scolymus]